MQTSDRNIILKNIPLVNLKILSRGIAAGLLSILLFSQCTKIKTTDVGSELIPTVDNVYTFDTVLTVETSNYLFGDSAIPFQGKSATGNVTEFLMGSVSNDPQFGKTQATMFFELKPPAYPYAFENVKDSLSLDSVVLCIRWNSTWGDTATPQTVRVFELTDFIKPDSLYQTNVNFRYRDLLGSKTFSPSILNDTMALYQQILVNQLRIPLSSEFGQRLLAQDSSAGEPYHSDSLFRNFFKGFAVVPEAGSGNALMAFALSDTNTYLKLYYKVTKGGQVDTLSRSWRFGNANVGGCANRIQRSYNGSQLAAHLNNIPGGDSLVYVQSSPGTYTTIRMPSLDGFKAVKGNVIVHLAEVNMKQVPGPSNEFDNFLTPPGTLYMDFFDSVLNVQYPFLTDAFVSGVYSPLVFGGRPKYVPAPGGQFTTAYSFYITRYVQSIITRNTPNAKIYLYAPSVVTYPILRTSFSVTPLARGRVKLGGGTHSSQKMTLKIVYSRI